jgi:hypothetical protein
MRHLVQFLIPALIFAGVLWLLTRGRSRAPERERESDTGVFIVVLLVSATVAISTAFMLQAIWD